MSREALMSFFIEGPGERVGLIDQDGTKFHWRFSILILQTAASGVRCPPKPFATVADIIREC